MKTKLVLRLKSLLVAVALLGIANPSSTHAALCQMENLGRGVVAARASDHVLVSWRLFGPDPSGIGFNVYRSTDAAAAAKLNSAELTDGTNLSDPTVNLTQANTHFDQPMIGGAEQLESDSFTLTANQVTEPIVRVPLNPVPDSGLRLRWKPVCARYSLLVVSTFGIAVRGYWLLKRILFS